MTNPGPTPLGADGTEVPKLFVIESKTGLAKPSAMLKLARGVSPGCAVLGSDAVNFKVAKLMNCGLPEGCHD